MKWNLFWQNNIDSLIIEVNGCLIISPCMIANKTLSLIAWKLFWIEICVTGFDLNVHLCFFMFFLFFLGFDLFWKIIFEFLCLFQVWFILVSGLSFGLFSGQTSGLWFDLWLNQEFRVKPWFPGHVYWIKINKTWT